MENMYNSFLNILFFGTPKKLFIINELDKLTQNGNEERIKALINDIVSFLLGE